MRDTYRVTPHSGEWKVRRDKNEQASGIFKLKSEAVDYGRALAKKYKTEFVVHNLDGTISETCSYGNDPHPPKG